MRAFAIASRSPVGRCSSQAMKHKPRKYIKPGQSRDLKDEMVLPVGPDGKVRHVRTLDEKLVKIFR